MRRSASRKQFYRGSQPGERCTKPHPISDIDEFSSVRTLLNFSHHRLRETQTLTKLRADQLTSYVLTVPCGKVDHTRLLEKRKVAFNLESVSALQQCPLHPTKALPNSSLMQNLLSCNQSSTLSRLRRPITCVRCWDFCTICRRKHCRQSFMCSWICA